MRNDVLESFMNYTLSAFLITLSLFIGMLLLLEIGRRIGVRRRARDPEGAVAGTGPIGGAVFALLGLLIAFTFAGAASRFDTRRALIVDEANAIGTAYLRIDILPADTQPPLRDLFRRYVDSRLEVYRQLPNIKLLDISAVLAKLAGVNRLQGEIWSQAVSASRMEGASPSAVMLLLPALNEMIDITTTRTMAAETHPPGIIFIMLFGVALTSALLAGYEMAGGQSRNWLHMLGFAAVLAIVVYVILDMEFPRLGFIRVDAFDRVLVEVRKGMN